MKHFWRPSWDDQGVTIVCCGRSLLGRTMELARSDWPKSDELPGRSLLNFLVDRGKAEWTQSGAILPHVTAATLTEEQAQIIGLPPSVPFSLQVRSRGTLEQPDFELSTSWRRLGHTPVQIQRTGAVLEHGTVSYRLPGVLYDVLEAVDAFNRTSPSTDRVAHIQRWLPVQQALRGATGIDVSPDGYLGDLRIFHAAALSLAVSFDKESGVTFDPMLFGRTIVRRQRADFFPDDPNADPAQIETDEEEIGPGSADGIDTLVDETDQLLPPALHQIFLRKRFDPDAECRPSYPLGGNAYVVLDPSLVGALNVVKRKQKGSAQERQAFVKNPRAAFAEALTDGGDEDTLTRLFVETQQYADRVNDIGLWQPKVLPWMPLAPNTWLPEKIGFTFGGQTVELRPEELDQVKRDCEAAIARQESTFSCGNGVEVPATADTLAAIEALRGAAEKLAAGQPTGPELLPQDDEVDSASTSDRYALTIDDNLENVDYRSDAQPRTPTIDAKPPSDLMEPDALFPHQREGFDWLIKSWTVGRPGALLADDMGLGKTIQTLAFAAWLDRHYAAASSSSRGPFLVVAPTALLRNWRAEHDKHLAVGGIGPIVELYGSSVSAYRQDGAVGRDISEGRSVLDRDRLASSSVILTTYETLANYHISLAGLRFPLVIFDEIQKLKTPTTINTHAAKTINADFVIGLTGTPVENNLTELWSIMDRLHPGLLWDLKSFTADYPSDDTAKLRELRDTLVSKEPYGAAVMLRRMKDATDLGRALPEKTVKPLSAVMPDIQANAYAQIVADARRARTEGSNKGMMLQVLQKMRGVSLHPEHPSTVLGRPESYPGYIARSARMQATIDALDAVAEKREKALVFIEFRDMQDLFADILRHRYDLGALPGIINGQTPSARRQALVDAFQVTPPGRFDVLVLAPRAAGLGLTITAANHVVHLSRWWNPAVEDQCNDRAYRIGQDKPVTVYCPIARHPIIGDASFDVTLNALLERKRALSRDLLVPMESERDYQDLYNTTIISE